MVLIDILIFIFVLGLLVFFHELGHFLAAKACGVFVDRFSLGMPPRAFGMRIGETDYCVGALPLGGYVKMAGQEDAPLSDEERDKTYGHVPEDRWFNKKPVWQRIVVIAAGPLMNVVLAVLLYGIVAGVGAYVRESDVDNRIGPIQPDSPATTAPMYRMAGNGMTADLNKAPDAVGWQTGDRILTINADRVRNIMDVGIDALLGGGKVMDVVVERTLPDGTTAQFLSPVAPKTLGDDGRVRFGVGPFDAALVDGLLDNSPAKAHGLQPGDIIVHASGKIVDASTFVEMVEKAPEGQPLTLDVDREGQILPITLTPQTVGRFLGLGLGSSWDLTPKDDPNAKPVVVSISEECEKQTGLKPKDIIEQVNGQPATLRSVREIEVARPGDTLRLDVRRPAILFGLLRPESHLTLDLPITPVRAIGVQLGQKMVFRRVPPPQVVPEAFRLTYQALARTMRTLSMLITGGVSPRELGGPVLIFQVTTAAAHHGYSWLLNNTAFISVNLCIFNLLPLPILDGSLLVYLLIEGIRRKPLDMRVLERIQQVGLVLIVGLLLYVTFNDVSRWITNLVP